MNTVYDKIDKLYASEKNVEPSWVTEIRLELKEIKALLKKQNSMPKRKVKKSQAYFEFVNLFREVLKADMSKEIYPEVHYKGQRIGANLKGLLYDKETTKTLTATEAFGLYEYFYEKKENLSSLIVLK
jgi:hypothetical protein